MEYAVSLHGKNHFLVKDSLQMPQSWWSHDFSQIPLLDPFLVFPQPLYTAFSTDLTILCILSLQPNFEFIKVEMITGSLSNVCIQLRSYHVFHISISWRRKAENSREATWTSRRYFHVRCELMKGHLGIEFICDRVRYLVSTLTCTFLLG